MPENIFVIKAVASATPSTRPTDVMVAPSTETRKTGSKLWISSDDVSMKRLTNPSAQTPRGIVRRPDPEALVRVRLMIICWLRGHDIRRRGENARSGRVAGALQLPVLEPGEHDHDQVEDAEGD